MSRFANALLLTLAVALPVTSAHARPEHIEIEVEADLNSGLEAPPEDFDRSTPRKVWQAFLQSCQEDRFAIAAHALNLKAYEGPAQSERGSVLANKLYALLQRTKQLSADHLSDNPTGPIAGDRPRNYDVAAKFPMGAGDEVSEVWLQLTRDTKSGSQVWLVSPTTLSAVSNWYEHIIEEKDRRPTVEVINPGLGPLPDALAAMTPRAAAEKFRELTNGGEYAEAARLLDLSAVPADEQAKVAPRLARRLALILQRLLPSSLGRLSAKKNGADEPGVPSSEDVVAQADPDDPYSQIRLARIRRAGKPPVWVFSQKTVAEIDNLYKRFGYGWAGDFLPTVFFRVQLFEVQLWQAIGLLVSLLVAWVLGLILGAIARRTLHGLVSRSKNEWDDALVEASRGPLTFLLFIAAFVVLLGFLALAEGPRMVVMRIVKLGAIWSAGWYLVRVLDVAADILMAVFERREDDMGLAMVPVARKIFRPLLVALVVLLGLQNIGLNVAGLLAGLGIGGLALAMASKSTVENMLGGITIAVDRPFKVGDTIKAAGFRGSVEEVGLRSTRLRTLERTLVTIPNGKLADANIENFAVRDKLRHSFTIGVQYDTTQDQMLLIIDEVKRYLLARPDVDEGFSVRLSELGDSSVNIVVTHYLLTNAWGEFTAAREEILMQACQIVGRAGAELAFPSQTIYTGSASEIDTTKAEDARKTVQQRKQDGTLCVPEIPDTVAEQLRAPTPAGDSAS